MRKKLIAGPITAEMAWITATDSSGMGFDGTVEDGSAAI